MNENNMDTELREQARIMRVLIVAAAAVLMVIVMSAAACTVYQSHEVTTRWINHPWEGVKSDPFHSGQ